MTDTDFDLRWSDEEDGFRCVLRPADKPWDAFGEVLELPMSTGASMPITALTLFIAIPITGLGLTSLLVSIPMGFEVGYAWFGTLLVVGIALRLALGQWLLPEQQDWIVALTRGRFTVCKGKRTLFSAGLEDLSVQGDEGHIVFTGNGTLALATGATPRGIRRLVAEIEERRAAHGGPAEVPRSLLVGSNLERTWFAQ